MTKLALLTIAAVVVGQPSAPPVYVEPHGTPSADSYWYCETAHGYYPYLKQCPEGWTRVAPGRPRAEAPRMAYPVRGRHAGSSNLAQIVCARSQAVGSGRHNSESAPRSDTPNEAHGPTARGASMEDTS